jgi:hypothetical protein
VVALPVSSGDQARRRRRTLAGLGAAPARGRPVWRHLDSPPRSGPGADRRAVIAAEARLGLENNRGRLTRFKSDASVPLRRVGAITSATRTPPLCSLWVHPNVVSERLGPRWGSRWTGTPTSFPPCRPRRSRPSTSLFAGAAGLSGHGPRPARVGFRAGRPTVSGIIISVERALGVSPNSRARARISDSMSR